MSEHKSNHEEELNPDGIDAEHAVPEPVKRHRKRKRNDDSMRAEKSLLEKQRRALMKKAKKSAGSCDKVVKKKEEKKLPKQLSALNLKAAKSQADEIKKRSAAVHCSSTPILTESLKFTGNRPSISPVQKASDTERVLPDKEMDGNVLSGAKVGKASTTKENKISHIKARSESTAKPSTNFSSSDEEFAVGKEKDESGEESSDEEDKIGNIEENEDKNKSSEEEEDIDRNNQEKENGNKYEDEDDDAYVHGKKPKPLKTEEYLSHLRYKKGDEDSVELHPGSGIYVNDDALLGLKSKSKTHSSIVRSLLEMVFTDDAVMKCSLLGGVQKGPLGKTTESRPGLYPKALKAIMDMAKHFCKEKKLRRESETSLHRKMGTKMSEMRARIRKEIEFKRMKEERKKEKKARKAKKDHEKQD
ncbi:myb-like protein X [Frankliniella occidentalis]|uniref:Myb-like protein X n=1 Tax=Frankliniella occidentalis TaxID=133901 RepID=A0A9C6XU67_FRAOC|nr:myb-like protein X [Frankliniella occidentalis]